MQKIRISDVTLREDENFSFKERINIAKKLDKLSVDIIETSKIKNAKTDTLFLHTIAPLMVNSTISCPTELNKDAVLLTINSLKDAKKARIKFEVPTSSVQMEYLLAKKPKVVLELIKEMISFAVENSAEVEFSALDATRSEKEFLYEAIKTAIEKGAKTITVCDTAGEMLPNEYEKFIDDLYKNVDELKNVTLGIECSNNLNMANALIVSAISKKIGEIKTSVFGNTLPKLTDVAKIFKCRGDFLGASTNLNYTELEHTVARLGFSNGNLDENTISFENVSRDSIKLNEKDDINTVSFAISKLGYDLSEEDKKNVYEEFLKVASKKEVGERELDVIIASVALQTAPTYKLKNYIINSGNVINASCVMTMTKAEEEIKEMTIGDGPIDAAFQCIEKIAGRNFELDDFQIQAVTEGKEAVGVTVIKLRSNGKLYSGKGVSTDIVESSINAYINALNKICFEEV